MDEYVVVCEKKLLFQQTTAQRREEKAEETNEKKFSFFFHFSLKFLCVCAFSFQKFCKKFYVSKLFAKLMLVILIIKKGEVAEEEDNIR